MNDDENDSPLRRFLNQMDIEKNFPENYSESPIYKKGQMEGYNKGIQDAWIEANKVISPIRSILQLHDRSWEDHLEEE